MTDALRSVLLAADGAGQLTGDGVRSGRAEHPVCGDIVAFDVRMDGVVIEELAWQARGCPACMAVAAATPQALRGSTLADAPTRLRQRLDQLGGLKVHERHAERLVLEALSRVE